VKTVCKNRRPFWQVQAKKGADLPFAALFAQIAAALLFCGRPSLIKMPLRTGIASLKRHPGKTFGSFPGYGKQKALREK